MNKKIILLLAILLFSFVFVAGVEARELEADYPGLDFDEDTGIAEVISYLFTLAVGIGFLVVVAMLMYGGILYLTSLGNPERTKSAIDKISSAIFGLSILLLFVVVAQVINPALLVIDPKPPGEIDDVDIVEHPPIEREPGDELIVEENPLGHYLEHGVNSKEQREVVFSEIMGTKRIIVKEREINPTLVGVSGVNKYLRTQTDRCSCDKSEVRCADGTFLCASLGCDGDPCEGDDGEPRNTITELEEINKEITEDLIERRDAILREKEDLEKNVRRFQELEQRMVDCQPQGLTAMREQMWMYDEAERMGANIETKTHKEMDIAGAPVNPLSFYCSIGGTLVQKEVYPRERLDIYSLLWDEQTLRVNCPYEYDMGRVSDEIRELSILQIIKMEELAEKIAELIMRVQEVSESAALAGVKSCDANCSCIPNPLVWMDWDNPCLQCVGRCDGTASPDGGPADGSGEGTGEIARKVKEIQKLEEEISDLISEINGIMIDVSRILGERVLIKESSDILTEENGYRTKAGKSYLIVEEDIDRIKIRDDMNHEGDIDDDGTPIIVEGWIGRETAERENNTFDEIREGAWECHSSEVDERWVILDAERAKGAYQHDNLIIQNPHPRNIFCCGLSERSHVDDEDLSVYKDAHYNIIPAESFGVLPGFDILEWDEGRECVERWYCEDEISLSDQEIETVSIGENVWMKENMDTEMGNSSCYDNDPDNCEKYGRLYDFETAEKVCPPGYRLPTSEDFGSLGSSSNALKDDEEWNGVNGTNFSALPAGRYLPDIDSFIDLDDRAYFWVSQGDAGTSRSLRSEDDGVYEGGFPLDNQLSVRCIKEEDSPNQYDDASYSLKQQLSCMRERLDDTEKRLEQQSSNDDDVFNIGVISYISDHRLYLVGEEERTCSWFIGELQPGGCSWSNETVYGQTRISPHYGGRDCNDTRRSFAVSFSDIENAEHLISAAKECNPLSYVSYKIPNTGEDLAQPHIQISIAGAYGCGAN